MLFFGHMGLTLAAARSADKVLNISNKGTLSRSNKGTLRNISTSGMEIDYRMVFLGSLLPDIIDKSILFVASNETLRSGRYIAHSLVFPLGLILIGLVIYWIWKNSLIFVIGSSSLIHLILDGMWTKPGIFLWPVYNPASRSGFAAGPGFASGPGFTSELDPGAIEAWSPVLHDIRDAIEAWSPALPDIPKGSALQINLATAQRVLLNPYVGIPEILGGLIILYFIIQLLRKKQIKSFIKTGALK